MSTSAANPRNPGPPWGYAFLIRAQRDLPRWLFRPGVLIGTWVALAFMPAQRKHSREFLTLVYGRPATLVEIWRHFLAFADFLLLKLRVVRGVPHHCALAPGPTADFTALVASRQQALFGTFHFGHSDLLGFYLGDTGRRISMIRLKVSNSDDTRLLGEMFGRWVSFIWVNERENLLYALKTAIQAGESLAMKCDRLEFSAKTEVFHFLGCRRVFPFTIYHLAVLFDRPVMFCIGTPGATEDETRVHTMPLFTPDGSVSRAENLRRGQAHFQSVLALLESLVRQYPALWFNYLALNPEPPSGGTVPRPGSSA